MVPTVGFASSRGKSGTIAFDDGSGLDVGDFKSDVGFAGLSGVRQSVLGNGTAALSQFATVTHYADFSNEIQSTLVSSTSDPQQTNNSTLGSYSEVSLGMNYVQVLQPGAFAEARQLSASLRADLRTGEQVDSWGLVAQIRAQF